MTRKSNRPQFWILMLLISALGMSSMSGCFVATDRDHDHGWHDDDHHDDHHDDHPDWH